MRKILPQQAVDQFNTIAPRLGAKRITYESPAGYAEGRAKLLQLHSLLGEARRLAVIAERAPRMKEVKRMCEEIVAKPGWTQSRISITIGMSGSHIAQLKLGARPVTDKTYTAIKQLYEEVMTNERS